MINGLLLWALPDSWTQFELLASEVDEQVESEMGRRFQGTDLDEVTLASVSALLAESLREVAANGVVLLAIRAEPGVNSADPPPGLSLTLALANRPDPTTQNHNSSGEHSDNSTAPPKARSSNVALFVSEATPLPLESPALSAFAKESRQEVLIPGIEQPLSRFQAQVFVLPKDHAGMAVITVTTFQSELEHDARGAARAFANTLVFVTAGDGEHESGDA